VILRASPLKSRRRRDALWSLPRSEINDFSRSLCRGEIYFQCAAAAALGGQMVKYASHLLCFFSLRDQKGRQINQLLPPCALIIKK
jgi:hypothetical protein